MSVTLLGPQRRPTVDRVVRSLDVEGYVATVTAGWQDREADDGELDDQLDGRSVNLRLHERWGQVQERDPELAAAVRRRRDELQELRSTYLVRLAHALAAVQELAPEAEAAATAHAVAYAGHGTDTADAHPTPRERRSTVRAEARARAIEDVRRVDAEHLLRLDEHNDEFVARWAPHEREAVAAHRAEVATCLEGAAVLAIAGGHVGVLLALVHLFAVDPPPRLPIVAWSAGAMVLTEQVVLFHDRTVQGPSDAEVYGRGLGVVAGVVLLPHARDRLLLSDADRMTVFGLRFAPARCLPLDPGARVEITHDGVLTSEASVLGVDGRLVSEVDG